MPMRPDQMVARRNILRMIRAGLVSFSDIPTSNSQRTVDGEHLLWASLLGLLLARGGGTISLDHLAKRFIARGM